VEDGTGVQLTGSFSITTEQLQVDGEQQTACAVSDGDEDEDGVLSDYYGGTDCDDSDSGLVGAEGDGDGFVDCDDCDDGDFLSWPGSPSWEGPADPDFDCSGSAGQSLSLVDLGGGGASFVGEAADSGSGYSVASAGDVDGDGLDDILIGAPGHDQGGSNAGMTYLMLGSTVAAGITTGTANWDLGQPTRSSWERRRVTRVAPPSRRRGTWTGMASTIFSWEPGATTRGGPTPARRI